MNIYDFLGNTARKDMEALDQRLKAAQAGNQGTISPAYGVGATQPSGAPALQQIPTTPTVPIVSPQANTPAAPAAQPGQTKPPAAPALSRATVPTAGPTLANAAALGTPNLPNFVTEGVASPGVPAPTYPTTPGPGAGGLTPIQNTPGTANPYQMYAGQQGNALTYGNPQGSATLQAGTGTPAGMTPYKPGQNALGLTLGTRGQGTLSALSGPSAEQQAATAQTVAGIESQIAALRDLREARNPGVTTGNAGAFGPLISVGSAGQGFGDDIMARDRAARTLSSIPYDTPRTQRANALANAELRERTGAEQFAGRAEQANRYEAMFGPSLQRQAAATQAGMAQQTEMAKINQSEMSDREKRLMDARQQQAAAQQKGFENELALRGLDLKTAEYLQGLGQKQGEAVAKGRGQYASDAAKAEIETRKAELVKAAANAKTPAEKQAFYEELAKLPGSNANVFNPMAM